MRLPSELKNEASFFKSARAFICTLFNPSTTAISSPVVISTGAAGAGTAEAAADPEAAAAEVEEPEAALLDQEAATICATPILLQFLLAFVLSWRTKLGGNLKIIDDTPLNDTIPTARAEIFGVSSLAEPEKSGSDRHSNDDECEDDEPEKTRGHENDDTAISTAEHTVDSCRLVKGSTKK